MRRLATALCSRSARDSTTILTRTFFSLPRLFHTSFNSRKMPPTSGSPLLPVHDDDNTETETSKWCNGCRQIFTTTYRPNPNATSFLSRLQEQQTSDDVSIKVVVLGSQESHAFFGVSLARRGIQPVWIEVDNTKGTVPLFLDRVKMDPNYYPFLEASRLCHFAALKQLAGYGLLSCIVYMPLAAVLPFKLITAQSANRQMDDYFAKYCFPLGMVDPGSVGKGYVFCSLDEGTKIVNVGLLTSMGIQNLVFNVPVPGLAIDYVGKDPSQGLPMDDIVECGSEEELKTKLENEPRAVFNKAGTKEGDPANLVVVGDFTTLLTAFGSRWDETEVISLDTCIKTAKSFVFGSEYRYSPVSALYLYGRSQDFALQRARSSISQRLHLRLWLTPMLFEGKPVWVGQVSRDIGVRFAKTWNLTTHKIDPNVDEARDYVVTDLLQSGHLDRVAYVDGVGKSTHDNPRVNLTGDPYVTNGKRAVIILSPTKTDGPPKILS